MIEAVFHARLALAYQRGLDHGSHKIDMQMRDRAWRWWSSAQAMGLVVQ